MSDALTRPDPKGRLALIRESLVDILEDDARNVSLARHMFKSDEQLRALGLEDHDIAKIRNWEMSKKEAASGLLASASRVEVVTRSNEEKGATVNVQNMVVQIPAPGSVPRQLEDAVIIDVEPTK